MLTTSDVGGLNIYVNNLPANGTATCYVGIVKALPVQADSVATPLTNPRVTIGSSQITFPTTLQAGQYIEFNSMIDCRVYDRNGTLLGSITPTGTLGTVAS